MNSFYLIKNYIFIAQSLDGYIAGPKGEFVLFCFISGGDLMNNDLKKIQQLDRRDIAASKTQDHQALLELWDKDGVALPPDQDPVVGMDAIRSWLMQSGNTDYDVTRYEHQFQERKIISDWAFEWGTFHSVAVSKADGAAFESSGKLLRILKRQPDGEWKVARAIWNVEPADE